LRGHFKLPAPQRADPTAELTFHKSCADERWCDPKFDAALNSPGFRARCKPRGMRAACRRPDRLAAGDRICPVFSWISRTRCSSLWAHPVKPMYRPRIQTQSCPPCVSESSSISGRMKAANRRRRGQP